MSHTHALHDQILHEAVEAQFMSRLRAMLAEADFNSLWAEGQSLTMEQAIQLALSCFLHSDNSVAYNNIQIL